MKKSETHTLWPAFFESTSEDLQVEVTVLLESCFFLLCEESSCGCEKCQCKMLSQESNYVLNSPSGITARAVSDIQAAVPAGKYI